MAFPIGPDPRSQEPETDFLIQDPFGLRRAVTPVFAFDLNDGMLVDPVNGLSIGLGTSFYVTPFGHQLSAMHVVTDFLNELGVPIRPGPEKNLIQPERTWIGIYQDPGLVFGARPAGSLLLATDFVLFPVDQLQHPLAVTFTSEQLNYVEPSLDLASWNISGLNERRTTFLPMRVGCRASIAEGDRVLAAGYPEIKSWRRPGAQIVSFQEEMRGSIGRVTKVDRTWEQGRKVWPTFSVDVHWKPGMSGGPVFNENGEVVGIVSRGGALSDEAGGWGHALWLEALPYRQDIYGCIDPMNPGWILGWGVCNNAHSLVELFPTREGAEAYAGIHGPGLSVRYVSTQHPARLGKSAG
ncbi:serine protease [Bradyrhizobium sp. BR13661]|jgi:serine protease Do|uniref:S1 family peptidase n=1 Tax=Bradyrhizobium sp. BR13661 TaxID=2940622 RepID=UPI002476C1DC|nr:serine protease [Bradyrhizobium sp. BR13661]MDH6263861.1 serine protease Do [Bradyrhizobium sp. BR13661]